MAALAPIQNHSQKVGFSIPETCELMGVSRQTVYDLINAGLLRSYTIGRRRFCSRDAILDCVKAREAETNASSDAAA